MIDKKETPTGIGVINENAGIEQDKYTDNLSVMQEDDTILCKIPANVELAESHDLPTWYLPTFLKEYIEEAAKVYGNPKDYWTATVMSAISAAARKSIALNDGKYINFAQEYMCLVGRPGIGKTVCIDKGFKQHRTKDTESYNKWSIDYKQWEKVSGADKEAHEPVLKTSLTNDFTIEKLFVKLSENSESTSLIRDEINGWFANMGKYTSGSDIERYLELFNNQHTSIERIGRKPLMLSKPFLTIFGGIQPKVLTDLLSKNNITANGMVQRFLWVFPDNAVAKKRNKGFLSGKFENGFDKFIEDIMALNDRDENEMYLSEAADDLYDDFSSWIANQVNECEDDYWCAVLEKMNIHCLRIALIATIARMVCGESEEPEGGEVFVNVDAIKYAWDCCKYFLWSSKKVQGLCNDRNRNSVTTNITKESLILELGKKYPEIQANKQRFADAIGVKREYVSRCLAPMLR